MFWCFGAADHIWWCSGAACSRLCNVCTCICVCVCVCVCVCAWACVCMCVYIHVYMYMYEYIWRHLYVYTHIHTHTHIHTNTRSLSFSRSLFLSRSLLIFLCPCLWISLPLSLSFLHTHIIHVCKVFHSIGNKLYHFHNNTLIEFIITSFILSKIEGLKEVLEPPITWRRRILFAAPTFFVRPWWIHGRERELIWVEAVPLKGGGLSDSTVRCLLDVRVIVLASSL